MGLYNVIEPCVIGTLHHTTAKVVEVDDEVAAALVEAGKLESIKAASEHPLGWPHDAQPRDSGPYAESTAGDGSILQQVAEEHADAHVAPIAGVESAEKPAPRPRGRRRSGED